MIVAVTKMHFAEMKPQVVSYRKYKGFHEISKAIMTRSRLRNRFSKNRSEENQKLFCKQKNNNVSLLRRSIKDYFENLKREKHYR